MQIYTRLADLPTRRSLSVDLQEFRDFSPIDHDLGDIKYSSTACTDKVMMRADIGIVKRLSPDAAKLSDEASLSENA